MKIIQTVFVATLFAVTTPVLAAQASPPASAPRPTAGDAAAEFAADLDRSVQKVDDTHYQVNRSLFNKVLADPGKLTRQARIVPSMKDGQPNGIRLYALKPDSACAKLGMHNGDTIHTINGVELTSLDQGLEVYGKVKDARRVSIQLTRRGQPTTLEYTIK